MSSTLIPDNELELAVEASSNGKQGDGEFHDVDKLIIEEQHPSAAEALAVLPRELFNETVSTLERLLSNSNVKMANGAPTDRFCFVCQSYAPFVHNVGNVTCDCICHSARRLVVSLKAL